MNPDLLYAYRRFRKHQLETYGNSGLHVQGVDQRQFTGGGAAYGLHAYAAWNSARRFLHFHADLSKTVADQKKRSKAAKKAWKTRRNKLAFASSQAA